MDLEELKVIISAKTAGFKEAVARVTEQIKQVQKESKKVEQTKITPDVDTSKIQSKMSRLIKSMKEQGEKLKNSVFKGIMPIKTTYSDKTDSDVKSVPKSTKSTRAPPVMNTEELKAQIASTSAMLDNLNSRIEVQKEKLNELRQAYEMAFNPNTKGKLQDKMLKVEGSINRMVAQSDKLGFKLSDLDEKLEAAGADSKKAASGMNTLANSTKKVSDSTKKASDKIKSIGKNSKSASKGIGQMNMGFGSLLKMMIRFYFISAIITTVVKGIKFMGEQLYANLQTNQQFVNSLNQIKTNLMVAFTPIYQAVLPAINALMSALATITAYIASFVSAIFGKTYQQSFQATRGLIAAKNAMGQYGGAAKKAGNDAKAAQKSLMGFDEINKIDKPQDDNADEGGGAPTLVQPNLDMTAVDGKMQDLADRIKSILSKAFEPIKNAWNKEGLNTIKSIKYGLNNVWDLIKAIGKSFAKVWLNGTGEKTCTLIFQILQNIFNIIGDIAGSFGRAWQKGDIGTSIVQHIWNSLNNILALIKVIGDNWRNAWNDNGAGDKLADSMLGLLESIAELLDDVTAGMAESFGKATETLFPAFIEFCTNVVQSLTNVADGFKIIWDNGGKVLFDGIVQLIAQVGELILKLTSGAFSDFSKLFKDVLAPAIGIVFDAIGNVISKLDEFIDWVNGNESVISGLTKIVEAFFAAWAVGKIVEFMNSAGGLIGILSSIASWLSTTTLAKVLDTAATGALTIAHTAWSVIAGIASIATTALGAAFTFLTSPIGLVCLAIAAVIAIGYELITHWDTVKQVCGEVWDWIQQKFQAFDDWLGSIFTTDWSKKLGVLGEVLNGVFHSISQIWDGIKEVFNGVITFIKGVFTGNWSQAWEGIKQIFKGVWDQFVGIAKAPINAIIGLINGLTSKLNNALSGLSFDIPDWVPGIGGKHFSLSVRIPKIPYLARGGIVDKPTPAIIGDAGKEAVIPLENNTNGINTIADTIADRIIMANMQGTNMSSQPINQEIVVKIGEETIIDTLTGKMNGEQRRQGKTLISV